MTALRIKIFITAIFFFALTLNANAFLFDLPILSREAVGQLSDDKLVDTYIDVEVEAETVQLFYSRSSFTPKEYEKIKELLKYRVYLMQEMQKRKIEIPKTRP